MSVDNRSAKALVTSGTIAATLLATVLLSPLASHASAQTPPTCNDEPATIVGTPGPDEIT